MIAQMSRKVLVFRKMSSYSDWMFLVEHFECLNKMLSVATFAFSFASF